MTELLERALAKVRSLPPEDQDSIAQAMLALSGERMLEAIDPAHLDDVLEGLSQVKREDFASPADVTAAFARFSR